jgi:hypothetical protein
VQEQVQEAEAEADHLEVRVEEDEAAFKEEELHEVEGASEVEVASSEAVHVVGVVAVKDDHSFTLKMYN